MTAHGCDEGWPALLPPSVTSHRSGIAFGIGAYTIWGLFPLYLALIEDAGDAEILAQRVIWSLVIVIGLLAVGRTSFAQLRAVTWKQLGQLSLASLFLGGQWAIYIWAARNDHLVEASLGYFFSPLVSVALGVMVLRERLRLPQRAAVAVSVIAVVVLTVGYGRPPWIAIALALGFGGYGLMKKKAGVATIPSLGLETAVLFLPALAYALILELDGDATFGHTGWIPGLLLASAGLVTAVPLLLFGAAAVRIPLTTLGPLQYVTPTLQFLLAVIVFHEPVPPLRLAGLVLVWIALAISTVDTLRVARGMVTSPAGERVSPLAGRDKPKAGTT